MIAQLSALTFIITSMLAIGLSLTVKQIVDPLRNVRLVLLALLANFVLAPALAYRHYRDLSAEGFIVPWPEVQPEIV